MDLDVEPDEDEIVVATTERDELSVTINPAYLANDIRAEKRRVGALSSPVPPFVAEPRITTNEFGRCGKLDDGYRHRENHHDLPPAAVQQVGSILVADHLPTISVIIPSCKFQSLPYSTSRSGLVYDTRMRFHQHIPLEPGDPNYDPLEQESHPETPSRLFEIFNELKDANLIEDEAASSIYSEYQLIRIPFRPASPSELCLVHSEDHVQFVRSLVDLSEDELKALSHEDERASVYFNNFSWASACLAAGGAIEATRAVVGGRVKNAFALIRPPGHHAEPPGAHIGLRECGGFCLFNNVPIATRVIQDEFKDQCRKVLILDWDVHHGNGIQRTFYDDPNVLYISLHLYLERDGSIFYPCSDYADCFHCGSGPGLGRNVNIPWITPGMGDADYMLAFQQIVMPIALEFDPDLVMISAGFDAAEGDTLGNCHVTPAGYAHMTYMLMQLAKGKVVACLEGGYNLRSIAKSALAMTRTLMGEPPERLRDLSPTAAGVETVQTVIRTQANFWKCLYPKDAKLRSRKHLGSERLHDIVREWQGHKFWEDYRMSPMLILRPQISRSFQGQVLATSNYQEERPLLIIFHDPPEATGFPDLRTNQLELHNTWLTDVSKTYVDWAVKHHFAVIDVNIPKYITDVEDDDAYMENNGAIERANHTKVLANYIWENYVEVNDSSHIFLLGIGDAYGGLINLLSEHRSCIDEVTFSVSFIAQNPLRAVMKGDDTASKRYYQRSMNFVAADHAAFDLQAKRLKQKYGTIVKSPYTDLQEMMAQHREAVTDKWLQLTKEWRREHEEEGPERTDGDDKMRDIHDEDIEEMSALATQANYASIEATHEDICLNGNGNGTVKPLLGVFRTATSLMPSSPSWPLRRSPNRNSRSPRRR